MSQDVAAQEAEEIQDEEAWSRGSMVKVESIFLRGDLLSTFANLGLQNNNKKAHARYSEFLSETDNIKVMSYPTFNNFMNDNSKSLKGLKQEFRTDLQVFWTKHAAVSAVLVAAAAAGEPDDDESEKQLDSVCRRFV